MREPDAAFADPRLAVLYDVVEGDRSDLDMYAAIAEEVGARRLVDVGCGTGSLALLLAARGIDLASVADCLRTGGWFAFETRRLDARAWERWDMPPTTVELPGGATASVSRTVTEVALPLVSFESVTVLDGEVLTSTSTLRYRDLDELARDLDAHGFDVVDVRDAPDRPGLEHVVLARRRRAAHLRASCTMRPTTRDLACLIEINQAPGSCERSTPRRRTSEAAPHRTHDDGLRRVRRSAKIAILEHSNMATGE